MLEMVPGHQNRWRTLRESDGKGPVVYWMSRDQRLEDNWALYHAWARAREGGKPLGIMFCLATDFLGAGPRHYRFMLEGLAETRRSADRLGIPFFLMEGDPSKVVPGFLEEWKVAMTITDLDPLRQKADWRSAVMKRCDSGFEEVDAHNIVPCWVASPKQEFAAATFRPKIKRHLPDRLEFLPPALSASKEWPGEVDTAGYEKCSLDTIISQTTGGREGLPRHIRPWMSSLVNAYPDTARGGTTQPGLDLGTVSLPALRHDLGAESCFEGNGRHRSAIGQGCFPGGAHRAPGAVRQLLLLQSRYDSPEGFPSWARATLRDHQGDRREYI